MRNRRVACPHICERGNTVLARNRGRVRQHPSDFHDHAGCQREERRPRRIGGASHEDRAALHVREVAGVVDDDDFALHRSTAHGHATKLAVIVVNLAHGARAHESRQFRFAHQERHLETPVPFRLDCTLSDDVAERVRRRGILDGACDLLDAQQKVVLEAIQPAALDEAPCQHQMPGAHDRQHADHVGPALLAPYVVLLDCREQLARSWQQRPAADPGHAPLELGADGIGFRSHAYQGRRSAVVAAVAKMRADRLKKRCGIFGVPGQRPVRFVQPSMAVAIEKAVERGQERRAVEGDTDVGRLSVRFRQPRGCPWLVARQVGKSNEIERLLGADRALAHGEM